MMKYSDLPGGDVAMQKERERESIIARDGTINELRKSYGLPQVEWGNIKLSEAKDRNPK